MRIRRYDREEGCHVWMDSEEARRQLLDGEENGLFELISVSATGTVLPIVSVSAGPVNGLRIDPDSKSTYGEQELPSEDLFRADKEEATEFIRRLFDSWFESAFVEPMEIQAILIGSPFRYTCSLEWVIDNIFRVNSVIVHCPNTGENKGGVVFVSGRSPRIWWAEDFDSRRNRWIVRAIERVSSEWFDRVMFTRRLGERKNDC